MKYIIYMLCLGFILTLNSCFEDELTLVPADGITDENFWISEENAEAALIPMYRGRSYWRLPSFAWDFYGDPSGTGATSGPANAFANQLTLKAVTPENEFIVAPYAQLYGYINHANIFLNNVDRVEFKDPARKEAAKGEARFIRAMYYFYMNMIWGGVPDINHDPIPLHPERETEETIYSMIIEDLKWAIDNLPETNIGVLRPGEWECRPDQYAAKALLAKVLMTAGEPNYDLDRALELIDDVIGSGKYKLEEFYGDLMMVDNKDNEENIFLINFTSKMNHPFDGSNAASLAIPGQVWFRATPEFYNSFEVGDTRRDVNINYFPIFGEYYVQKMGYDPRAVNGFTYDNYPQYILRLADIYLLKAEGLAKKDFLANIDEACDLVELVRDRAFPDSISHTVYTAADFSNFDEFWEFLWWERRKEVFFECQTFFDAKRMGMCQKMLGLQKWQEVLPFSTDDLTLNPNLKQNEGY